MADLAALIARVEGATGPDREIDARLEALWQGSDYDAMARDGYAAEDWKAPTYTDSIDAALALVERMGEGSPKHPAETTLTSVGNSGPWRCAIWLGVDDTDGVYRAAPTAPLAIILALLKALQARAGQ